MITLTGKGFAADAKIYLNGVDITSINSRSATSITCKIPVGAMGGGYMVAGLTESHNTGDVGDNHRNSDFWLVRLGAF